MGDNEKAMQELVDKAKAAWTKGAYEGLVAVAEYYGDPVEVRHGEPVGDQQSAAFTRAQIDCEIEVFADVIESWTVVDPVVTIEGNMVIFEMGYRIELKDGSVVEFGGDRIENRVEGGKIVMQNHPANMEAFAKILTPDVMRRMGACMLEKIKQLGESYPKIEAQIEAMLATGAAPTFG